MLVAIMVSLFSIVMVSLMLLWNKPIILIYLLLMFCLVCNFFTTQIGIPSVVKYGADLLVIYLFAWALYMDLKLLRRRNGSIEIGIILMLVILSITTFVIYRYSMVAFLIAYLKFFRYFMLFYVSIVFFEHEDVDRYYYLSLIFLALNTFASSFQFFIQGIKWDYNGGLFGTEVGGNGQMNLFLVIVSVYATVMGISKKKPIWLTFCVLGMATYISILSELKIYFIELAIIIVLSVIVSKPSVRTLSLALGSGIMLVVAVKLMGQIYPIFKDFFSIETITDYISNDNYGGELGNLNRTTALPHVIENYLLTPAQKLFGVGLGNADPGSALFGKYGYSKYTWFFSSYVAASSGIVGLLLYALFYFSVGIKSLVGLIREVKHKEYYMVTLVLAAMSPIIIFYDGTLFTSTAYIYFAAMALPFVVGKRGYGKLDRMEEFENV